MASAYDKASLVMLPHATKEGKLYSVKPEDRSGDFTFSRGTSATRVNASGLIEKERGNITLYSNDFSNWTANQSTITSNSIVGPFGTDDADLMTLSATNDEHNVYYSSINTSANNVYTQSFYVKKGTGRYMAAWMYFSANLGGPYATYDLDTNTLVANGSTAAGTTYIDSKIEVLSGGWVRISVTGISTSATSMIPAIDARTSGSLVPQNAYIGAGETFYIYGAQLEQGLVATDYIETTTAAVYEGITDNLPRLDYSGGASCPSLLLEPSRTNLVANSEYFNSADNTSANVTATDNAFESLSGYVDATEFESTSTSGGHFLGTAEFTLTSGTTYTSSVFVKKGSGRYFQTFFGGTAFTSLGYANFDLQEGIVTAEGSAVTGDIEDYGNGWWRVYMTGVAAATGVNRLYVCAIPNGTSGRIGSHNQVLSYYIYGAQVEAGSYPTSYIPTYGTSASRVVDVCSKTGISSLIGQTEGTLFLQVNNNTHISEISDGTNQDRIVFYTDGNNYLRNLIRVSTITQSNIQTNTTIQSGDKIALAYANNDCVIYKNGVEIGSDTSLSIPSTSKLNIGSDYNGSSETNNTTKQALLFKTRLTNAELAALTTI